LQTASDGLRDDDRDPVDVLTRVALDAVSTYRASAPLALDREALWKGGRGISGANAAATYEVIGK
jgi:hypothetical protein